MVTIRISKDAYIRLMEIGGLLQVVKKERLGMWKVVDWVFEHVDLDELKNKLRQQMLEGGPQE